MKNISVRHLLLLVYCLFAITFNSICQISLTNPSFEDTPSDATVPKGWMPCNAGTTPDILPGFWGEYGDPSHGNTYVGLITRENNTLESIGQRLSGVLKKGTCYKFSLDLAHGKVYAGYNNPLKIRVWVGKNKCDRGQLIYESPFIKNSEWETHVIEFEPKSDVEYIIIEAFYSEERFSYKGNVLIDKVGTILACGRV